MSTATLEQEEKAFTTLCDDLIAGSPDNKDVENAVIELEVGHKKCLNAARREFNSEVDKNEATLKKIREDYDKAREQDKKALQKQLEEVRKDYQNQLEQLRQRQTEEVERIKDTYDTIDHERKRGDSLVGRLTDDHSRELQRVNDEWARKLAIKDTEIMALKREVEQVEQLAHDQLHEEEERTNAALLECTKLQQQVKDLDEQKVSVLAASKAQLDDLGKQQERVLKNGRSLVNALQDNADELEMALSRLRVTLLNQDYAKIRDAVRAKESSEQQEELLKKVDDLQARKESERQELTDLLDQVKVIYGGQKTAIEAFLAEVEAENQKLEDLHTRKDEELDKASQVRRSRAGSMSMPRIPSAALSRRLSARSRRGSTAVGHGYAQGDSPQPRRDSASARSGSSVTIHTDPSRTD